jgi:hypothetical protein
MFLIGKTRLGAHRAGLDIDLVIQGQETAGRQHLIARAIKRLDLQLRAFADALPLRWLVTMSEYNMEALTIFSWLWPPQGNPDWCLPVAASKIDGNYDCEMFMADAPTTRVLHQCNGEIWTASEVCWQIMEEPSCRSGLSVGFGGGFSMYRPHVIGRCAAN